MGFLRICMDRSLFSQFCLDIFGLVWISWVDPISLWICVGFYALLIISMNSSGLLRIGYHSNGPVFISGVCYWFLRVHMDFCGLVYISKDCSECLQFRLDLLDLSRFLWSCLNFYAHVLIYMNLPGFLCLGYDFYGMFLDFYGHVLICIHSNGFLYIGLHF